MERCSEKSGVKLVKESVGWQSEKNMKHKNSRATDGHSHWRIGSLTNT